MYIKPFITGQGYNPSVTFGDSSLYTREPEKEENK